MGQFLKQRKPDSIVILLEDITKAEVPSPPPTPDNLQFRQSNRKGGGRQLALLQTQKYSKIIT